VLQGCAFNLLDRFSASFGTRDIVPQYGMPTFSSDPDYSRASPVPERNAQPSPDFHAESRVIPVSGSVEIQAGVVSQGLETNAAESTHAQKPVFHLLGAREGKTEERQPSEQRYMQGV
jgi:hypothetical protein